MENWINLTDVSQLDEINAQSKHEPVVIFKHSTRCSISSMAWSRFNRGMNELLDKALKFYYLDLIQYREISNLIADKFEVRHESPQILVILNGKSIYNSSHMAIGVKPIVKIAESY